MKAIVTTINPAKYGTPPYLTAIIDNANAQELKGDFLFIFNRVRGVVKEDRAAFRAETVINVIFEE